MSSEPYVPSPEVVMEWAAIGWFALGYGDLPERSVDPGPEFDRMIAKVRADALREAADDIEANHITDEMAHGGYDGDGMMPDDLTIPEWLRERADRIEEEA